MTCFPEVMQPSADRVLRKQKVPSHAHGQSTGALGRSSARQIASGGSRTPPPGRQTMKLPSKDIIGRTIYTKTWVVLTARRVAQKGWETSPCLSVITRVPEKNTGRPS